MYRVICYNGRGQDFVYQTDAEPGNWRARDELAKAFMQNAVRLSWCEHAPIGSNGFCIILYKDAIGEAIVGAWLPNDDGQWVECSQDNTFLYRQAHDNFGAWKKSQNK